MKRGKTEVEPFRKTEEIKGMLDYFRERNMHDEYLILVFGLLTGRRCGDILSVKWSDVMYPNGRYKEKIDTIEEQKTDKIISLTVTPFLVKSINDYIIKTNAEPLKDIDDFIFKFASKTVWRDNRNAQVYSLNEADIFGEWCDFTGKSIDEKRKKKIIEQYKKQKEYLTIGDYLYYEIEYKDIIKSHEEMYRRKLKEAAKHIGIEYPIGTHSPRKTLGMLMKLSHPNDPYAMDVIQSIFGHSDAKITMAYIGLSEERKRQYFNDLSETIEKIESGETDVLTKNSPVVTIKNEDIREILLYMVKSEDGDIEKFNNAMQMIDDKRVKVI